MSADEFENVFDSLDADGNGYLTLEEFSSGFSAFAFETTQHSVIYVIICVCVFDY